MTQIASPHPRILIVVPMLNEVGCIGGLLDQLLPLTKRQDCDLILVDGGSQDSTLKIASSRTHNIVQSLPGRARQLVAGVAHARPEDIVWFLHADTGICAGALEAIHAALADGRQWGRFDLSLSGRHPAFRIIEWAINLRSRLTGVCTGDQGIFVAMDALSSIGGVPLQPLMEDIELCKRLKWLGRPACLRQRLVTSSRRWETEGILRTVLLMWWLRLNYFFGVSPAQLKRRYYPAKKATDNS